jgi:hypothetical protein
MARPTKTSVDYFPHMTHSGKTIAILEARWGNDGYAFWFKLLELLGDSSDFSFNCNRSADWEYLLSKTRVTESVARAILDKLAEVEAIDDACWQQNIVWSDNFCRNLEPVFEKRKGQKPQKPEFPQQKPVANDISADFRDGNPAAAAIIPTETGKVKESKLTESKATESEGEQSEATESESTEPEEREKNGAAARECASVCATTETANANDNPLAAAKPSETASLLEPATPVLPERLTASAAGKRSGRKVAAQPCPSSLRPGVAQQADTVFLTEEELARLCREFGEDGAQRLLEILDAYKSNNPEKSARYRDDYKVIRSWVIRRYREEQQSAGPHLRTGPGVMTHANPFIDKLAEMAGEE